MYGTSGHIISLSLVQDIIVTVDPPHCMDGIASKILWYFAFPFVLFFVPVKSIWYLLLIPEMILPILNICAAKVSTYPFFIANSQRKQLYFCEQTSSFNLVISLFHSPLYGICLKPSLIIFRFFQTSASLTRLRRQQGWCLYIFSVSGTQWAY